MVLNPRKPQGIPRQLRSSASAWPGRAHAPAPLFASDSVRANSPIESRRDIIDRDGWGWMAYPWDPVSVATQTPPIDLGTYT
jgi:hypothetical protein